MCFFVCIASVLVKKSCRCKIKRCSPSMQSMRHISICVCVYMCAVGIRAYVPWVHLITLTLWVGWKRNIFVRAHHTEHTGFTFKKQLFSFQFTSSPIYYKSILTICYCRWSSAIRLSLPLSVIYNTHSFDAYALARHGSTKAYGNKNGMALVDAAK